MTHASADSSSSSSDDDDDDDADQPPVAPKPRRCLRCRATFESNWAGNRVCSHCKSSDSWRSATPL
jgi:hypothetical protein